MHGGNLAGGMRRNRQAQFISRDPEAIVTDRDQRSPTIGDVNFDLGRPRIHGVFDQLFHRTRRALHHFSGGNLIHQNTGQGTNGHGRQRMSNPLSRGFGPPPECAGPGRTPWVTPSRPPELGDV